MVWFPILSLSEFLFYQPLSPQNHKTIGHVQEISNSLKIMLKILLWFIFLIICCQGCKSSIQFCRFRNYLCTWWFTNDWFIFSHNHLSFKSSLASVFRLIAFLLLLHLLVKTLHAVREAGVYVGHAANQSSLLSHTINSVNTFFKIHKLFCQSYSATCKTLYIFSTFIKF